MEKILKILKSFAVSGILLLSACSHGYSSQNPDELLIGQTDFCNLIKVKNVPQTASDVFNNYVLSDLGAWSGYALPVNESDEFQGAFIGPMNMRGYWVAASLAIPTILVNGEKYDLGRNLQAANYYPGLLMQEFRNPQLYFKTELCFATSRSVVVRSIVRNVSQNPVSFSLFWDGGVFDPDTELEKEGNNVSVLRKKDLSRVLLRFITSSQVKITAKDSLRATEKTDFILQPGEAYQSGYTQTLILKNENLDKEFISLKALDINECFHVNTQRWEKYIASLLNSGSPFLKDNKYRKIAVKAMMTLNSNYRTPAGDILHGGSYPSYNGFWGVWSWDSWKIASANALYELQMAKEEMLTLFDYQADNGMVPDFISYNKKGNNWRDSKPPLSAWGVMNVYEECHDKEFLAKMFDKIYQFHQWWYTDRDHDHNGICEYGSTDGTLIAAAWESGMDNGVRFDDTKMLRNGDRAWSMNQENICLNSFLYKEKRLLAEMAGILGKEDLAEKLNQEAEKVKEFVQKKMFDTETGFFYDIRISTGEFIKVMGAECWLPLWAGIATQEQAERVKEKMMNPLNFNSTLPLSTLDVSHPRLRPARGYWRGPVWVDQVYFGVVGLRNYGFNREADLLIEKFMNNAQGLTGDGPIHENYNPLTGETLNCPNFGWSAALIIKMLLNK